MGHFLRKMLQLEHGGRPWSLSPPAPCSRKFKYMVRSMQGKSGSILGTVVVALVLLKKKRVVFDALEKLFGRHVYCTTSIFVTRSNCCGLNKCGWAVNLTLLRQSCSQCLRCGAGKLFKLLCGLLSAVPVGYYLQKQ